MFLALAALTLLIFVYADAWALHDDMPVRSLAQVTLGVVIWLRANSAIEGATLVRFAHERGLTVADLLAIPGVLFAGWLTARLLEAERAEWRAKRGAPDRRTPTR